LLLLLLLLLSSGCSSYWPEPAAEGHLYRISLCRIALEWKVGSDI
jgi:hypothetical protein